LGFGRRFVHILTNVLRKHFLGDLACFSRSILYLCHVFKLCGGLHPPPSAAIRLMKAGRKRQGRNTTRKTRERLEWYNKNRQPLFAGSRTWFGY
jgi:hypothetical protein